MYLCCPPSPAKFQHRLYCSCSSPSSWSQRDGDILAALAVGEPSEATWLRSCPLACFLCGTSLFRNLAMSPGSNFWCGSEASSPDLGFAARFCFSFCFSCLSSFASLSGLNFGGGVFGGSTGFGWAGSGVAVSSAASTGGFGGGATDGLGCSD